jgi:hypothetical protein
MIGVICRRTDVLLVLTDFLRLSTYRCCVPPDLENEDFWNLRVDLFKSGVNDAKRG